MPINLPTALTWLRIILIPLLIGVYYLPSGWVGIQEQNLIAALIFIMAALTDWLDGYLARALNQASAFGAFLDPVADKLMVTAALIMLVKLGRVDGIIAMIIVGREITISALREWMAQIGASKSVAVSMIGKIKTVAQMTAILFLLYQAPLAGLNTLEVGNWLIYLAAALTLWSMGYYMRMAWPEIARRVDR